MPMPLLSCTRSLLALGALPLAVMACGDDSSATGTGGSGGGATTTATTTTSSTKSSTTTTATTTATTNATSTSTGMVDCSNPIEITVGAFTLQAADGTAAHYVAPPAPDFGDVEADDFSIELYGSGFDPALNGEDTGTFDLTMNADDNYATCSRCLLYFEDPTSPIGRIFFTQSGTFVIDATSTQLDGTITGTLTDVTLIEVTLDPDTFESTPVANGTCLHLATGDVSVPPPG